LWRPNRFGIANTLLSRFGNITSRILPGLLVRKDDKSPISSTSSHRLTWISSRQQGSAIRVDFREKPIFRILSCGSQDNPILDSLGNFGSAVRTSLLQAKVFKAPSVVGELAVSCASFLLNLRPMHYPRSLMHRTLGFVISQSSTCLLLFSSIYASSEKSTFELG
jgi:hypothetical protein